MTKKQYWLLLVVCACLALAGSAGITLMRERSDRGVKQQAGAAVPGLFDQVSLLRDFRSKRASSWNQTGKNADRIVIPPGEIRTLLEEPGAGSIKHFYWTYIERDEANRHDLFRGAVLRAFWDGAGAPSIEVPLGDFFGVSNGQPRPVESLAFTTNLGMGGEETSWGFNCYLPMPFVNGARIELENQSDRDVRLWFHIDYELYDSGSAIPANAGRLHARWNRENPTAGVAFAKGADKNNLEHRWQMENLSGDENYSILDVKSNGQFAGYFLTVVNIQDDSFTWWGEGDDMVFIDGESFPPSIHGTGSEEIFGGGCCPAEEYTGPYTGFHRVENWGGVKRYLGTNGMYRFYITDPLRFRKSIRVTIERGCAKPGAQIQ